MPVKEQAILQFSVVGANQGINEVRKFQTTTTKAMTGTEQSISRSLGSMVAKYASFAAAITATNKVLSSGVEFNKFVENQTMSFTVMMKSADKAKGMMKDLYDFAVNSPLTFKETAGASKQLMAYGFAAEELIPTMKSLGTVALATGHSLDDISYIYGTLRSQGRAYSRDLMQFGMRGIPIYEELAKVMGVNADQIQKMASEGKIGFKEVEKAFQNMTTNGGRFAGILTGYMTTLTGKLSMLTDMSQKSAGSLMSDTMPVLKQFVDKLTAILGTDKFQKTLKDLGAQIATVAKGLSDMILFAVNNLPLIVTLFETIIAMKIGKEMMNIANAFAGMGSAFGPIGLAIAAVLVTVISLRNELASIYREANEAGRTSRDSGVRTSQLQFDYDPTRQAGLMGVMGNALTQPFTGKDSLINKVQPSDVLGIAEAYKLTASQAANALIAIQALSKEQWTFYLNTKSADMALEDYLKRMAAMANVPKTNEELQADFLSSLTGENAMRYYDPDDINALGKRGADDYIKSFSDAMAAKKTLYQKAFTPDIQKTMLQAEMDSLYKALDMGAGITNLVEKTNYDETLIARIRQIAIEIEGLGKKPTAAVEKLARAFKQLGEYTSPDNIGLERSLEVELGNDRLASLKEEHRLTMANTDAEYFEKISTLKLEASEAEKLAKELDTFRYVASVESRADILKQYEDAKALAENKFADAVELEKELARVRTLLGIQSGREVAKEIEKINMEMFDRMKNGNPEFWDDQKARAGSGDRGAAAMTTLQGTEAGSMMAGADPITMAIISIAEFAKSMENVAKVLNPFATVLEAMRKVLEPIVNGIFEPMANTLEMFGEMLSKVLAPFMGFIRIVADMGYILTVFLMVPLQLVAGAFKWFYNDVIYPVGHWIIKSINAVIKQLNKLPRVHIKYLKDIEQISDSMEDWSDILRRFEDGLSATISYLANKLEDMINAQIGSLQDLYEVGAISGAEYEKKVGDINKYRINNDEALVSYADKQLKTQDDIFNRLTDLYKLQDKLKDTTLTDEQKVGMLEGAGITGTYTPPAPAAPAAPTKSEVMTRFQSWLNANPTAAMGAKPGSALYATRVAFMKAYNDKKYQKAADVMTSVGFATGTPKIPNDMVAQVHKGEGIIPATFMDGIRRGELSLSSGGNEGGGQTTNVYVTVQGSVQTENNLADSIANKINIRRSRGMLTV